MKNIISLRGISSVAAVIAAGRAGNRFCDVLKVPTGIKAQAMGGAYIGLAEGLDAMDINPAGISFISKMKFYLFMMFIFRILF